MARQALDGCLTEQGDIVFDTSESGLNSNAYQFLRKSNHQFPNRRPDLITYPYTNLDERIGRTRKGELTLGTVVVEEHRDWQAEVEMNKNRSKENPPPPFEYEYKTETHRKHSGMKLRYRHSTTTVVLLD